MNDPTDERELRQESDSAQRQESQMQPDTVTASSNDEIAPYYAEQRETQRLATDEAEAKQRAADEAKLESELKAAARASWRGSAETFERLWTQSMRDEALMQHMQATQHGTEA